MCLSPIKIKNVNKGGRVGVSFALRSKDCSSSYIEVPCGHCSECVRKRTLSYVQRCYLESLDTYVYMFTLTYKDTMLPVYHHPDTGEEFRYARKSDITNLLKRVRKYFSRPFRYFIVSEHGGKKGRPHYHGLLFVQRNEDDLPTTPYVIDKELFNLFLQNWSINVGSTRKPIYLPLCDYRTSYSRGIRRSTYDLHYIEPRYGDSISSPAFYVLKYLLKQSNFEIYKDLSNRYLPGELKDLQEYTYNRILCSKAFGSRIYPTRSNLSSLDLHNNQISDYVHNCISRSIANKMDYPCFFLDNGKSYPLCLYLRHKFLTLDDFADFYYRSDEPFIDNVHIHDDVIRHDKINVIYERTQKIYNLLRKNSVYDLDF